VKIFLDSLTPELSRSLVLLGRIIPALEKLGCTFQYEITNADVILVCNKNDFEHRKSSIPKAIRPVHIHAIDKPTTVKMNRIRTDMCEAADLVIWQCNWLRKKYKRLVGYRAKNEVVIHNAIDPAMFDGVKKMKKEYPKNVIMVAAWARNGIDRPRKRLREMLAIAYEYAHANEDVCFWVVGETNGLISKHKRVRFLGRIPFMEIAPILLSADAMLNLTWFDNCPNAVVEALAIGVPVVLNNETGAIELVRDDGGIIVPIDKEVTKYRKGKKPPLFDKTPVIEALSVVLANWPKFERPELHIDYAAKAYKAALEGLLK